MMSVLMLLILLLVPQSGQQPSPVTTAKISSPEKALRFEVTVPAPIDAVWTAFTTTAGLKTWLWSDVNVDLREGGEWLVRFSTASTGGGTIESFNTQRRLVIKALAPEQFPTVRRERTTATFEFAAVSPASTRVTLTQTGWKTGKEWDDAYEYLAKGNASLMTQLHQRFVSGPIDWSKMK